MSSDREASEYCMRDFNNFIKCEQLMPEKTYNADETAVYWKTFYSKTLASEQDRSAPGHKFSKERLTILSCVNGTSSYKLNLGVISKAKKLKSFKRIEFLQLPVDYFNQKER